MGKPKTIHTGDTVPLKNGRNTALLVIDVQKELFEKSKPIYQADQLLNDLCALIERTRSAGWPVIYIQHSADRYLVKGSSGWDLHPCLHPLAGDCIVHKCHGNAFQETDLEVILDAQRVGTVLVTGLVSHGCVQATCEGAKALGYHVILAEDGHSNYHRQAAEKVAEVNQRLSAMGIVELRAIREIVA